MSKTKACPACGAVHAGPFPEPINCEECGETIAADPKHVVGLSGGKDSVALAVWLVENEPRDYEFICNETGNESQEWRDHMVQLEQRLGAPIKRIRYHTDFFGMIEEVQMLPNFRARFCTRMLKIEPTIEYFANLPAGSVLYVGLRADEEERRGLYGEDIVVRFPLREQGIDLDGVWKLLNDRSIAIPARTDCVLCPYQRLGEWRNLWRDQPQDYQKGIELETKFGHTFRSPGRDKWPASLAELAKEFEKGRKIRGDGKEQTCRVCSI